MENLFSSPFTLGILGGGQLGKMMLTETRRYDLRTLVMDPSADAPCKIGCDEFHQGSLYDHEAVVAFGRKCNLVTFEIEHIRIEALEALEKEGIPVYPQPRVLRVIQNKVKQKEFYASKGLPTSPFIAFNSREELLNNAHRFRLPAVWKSAEGGYDGKGVEILRRQEQLEKLPDVPGLVEELVDFEMEIAVIVARNGKGETVAYPVVEMEFHPVANLVEYVISPARISEETTQRAQALAKRVANELDITGLLAVEMFLTRQGDILVNECAPRVHNSGHLTIEASFTSQFEQHLRAILGLPLGSTETKLPAVMVNLVGEEGHQGPVSYAGYDSAMAMKGVNIHLYGKKETRPFRKMGHVTIIDHHLDQARERAGEVKDLIKVISAPWQ